MRTCPICNTRFPNFYPLATSYFDILHRLKVFYSLEDFETLNIAQYSCPNCQTSDRDRLYALYAQQHLQRPQHRPLRILDIAPAPVLSQFLKSIPNAVYRSADLFSPLADDKVDLQDMHLYADESFDFILCSHVLEHVPNDALAIAELYRVLAKGGTAILMVPLLLTATETDEDPEEPSVDERWARFGQDDHVRLYAKADYLARLARGGFQVQAMGVHDFGAEVFKRNGITPSSVLYLGHK